MAKKKAKKGAAKKVPAIKSRYNKTQLLSAIAEKTELSKKQVGAVMEELTCLVERHVRKGAAGEFLLPGMEMARTQLADILDVVRAQGETGSHREPHWSRAIEGLGEKLDKAVLDTIGEKTLSALLDEAEAKSGACDRHPVDEQGTAADTTT